jgi:uncharacterized membrane protein
MNREEYLRELEKNIHSLPQNEIDDALTFYNEYLADMEENNPQNLNRLDPPQQIAAQIKADTAMKGINDKSKKNKIGLSTAWTVLLAVFALPIGLPIAISIATVAISLIVVAVAVLISLGAAAVSLTVYGIASLIAAIIILPTSFAATVFHLGFGLLTLGLGYLSVIGVYRLSRMTFAWIAGFINNMRIRIQNRQIKKQEVR